MAEMKRAEFEKSDGNQSRKMLIEHVHWSDCSGTSQWDQMKENIASGVSVFAGSFIAGIIPALVVSVLILGVVLYMLFM